MIPEEEWKEQQHKARLDRAKRYRTKNKEKVAAIKKRWRQNHPDVVKRHEETRRARVNATPERREAKLEYLKQYHQENAEHRSAQRKEQYQATREEKLARRAEYRKNNKSKIREAHLKAAYDISQVDYDKVLLHQNGCCYICKKPESRCVNGKPINLSVDHCHDRDKVRGLLCDSCNKIVGLIGDSYERAQRFTDYLRDPPAFSILYG